MKPDSVGRLIKIDSELLTPQREIEAFLPLSRWHGELQRSLRTLPAESCEHGQRVRLDRIGNNLALLLYFMGETQAADHLCRQVITSYLSLYKEGIGGIVDSLIQPFINRIRLKRLTGRYEDASMEMAGFYGLQKKVVVLEGVALPFSCFGLETRNLIVTSRVYETLKINLKTLNYSSIVAMDKTLGACASFDFYEEAKIIACAALARAEEGVAICLAAMQAHHQDKFLRAVFYYRFCELLHHMVAYAEAGDGLNKVVAVCLEGLLTDARRFLPLGVSVCRKLFNLGMQVEGETLLRSLLAVNLQRNDQLQFLNCYLLGREFKASAIDCFTESFVHAQQACCYQPMRLRLSLQGNAQNRDAFMQTLHRLLLLKEDVLVAFAEFGNLSRGAAASLPMPIDRAQ